MLLPISLYIYILTRKHNIKETKSKRERYKRKGWMLGLDGPDLRVLLMTKMQSRYMWLFQYNGNMNVLGLDGPIIV